MKTCCEHHGIDCCQGDLCPLREQSSWQTVRNVLLLGLAGASLIAVVLVATGLIGIFYFQR